MDLSQKLLADLADTRERNKWDWTTLAAELGVSPQRLSNWVKRGGVSKDAFELVMRRFPEFFVPGGAEGISAVDLLSLKLRSADKAQLVICSLVLEANINVEDMPRSLTMEEYDVVAGLVHNCLELLRGGKRSPLLKMLLGDQKATQSAQRRHKRNEKG